jgi:hypothetical protein
MVLLDWIIIIGTAGISLYRWSWTYSLWENLMTGKWTIPYEKIFSWVRNYRFLYMLRRRLNRLALGVSRSLQGFTYGCGEDSTTPRFDDHKRSNADGKHGNWSTTYLQCRDTTREGNSWRIRDFLVSKSYDGFIQIRRGPWYIVPYSYSTLNSSRSSFPRWFWIRNSIFESGTGLVEWGCILLNELLCALQFQLHKAIETALVVSVGDDSTAPDSFRIASYSVAYLLLQFALTSRTSDGE